MRKPVFKLFCLLLCVFCLWGCGQRQGGKTPESHAQELISYEIGDARATITGWDPYAEGEAVIPKQIEALPVTSIGDLAFAYSDSLISITIPDSVTSIGDTAFYRCSSLTSITIPDSVTSIGRSAFGRCRSLTSIAIPQAFHSGAEAFRLGLDDLWPDGFALPDSSSK